MCYKQPCLCVTNNHVYVLQTTMRIHIVIRYAHEVLVLAILDFLLKCFQICKIVTQTDIKHAESRVTVLTTG